MRISVDVRGELVRQGAQNLNAEIPQVGRRQIRTVLERIKRRMEGYPPERPGQRYKRTGRFFYSWGIDRVGNTGYVLKNTARSPKTRKEYGQYVVGNAYGLKQAWMHKGRWELLRDVVDQEVAELPDDVEKEIVMVARRENL